MPKRNRGTVIGAVLMTPLKAALTAACLPLLSLGLGLSLSLWPGTLLAADWTASPGQSLQPLVANAAGGDLVILPKGRYPGPLVIDRALTLRGEDGAVIDGGGTGHAVIIEAPDTVIDGVGVENWGADLTAMDAGIFIARQATGSVVQNARLQGPGFGIFLDGVHNAVIQDNVIRGDAELRSQDRGNGVHLFNVENVRVAGNDIRQTRDGIYIDTSRETLLQGNRMQDLRYGVHYMYAHDNRLEGNVTVNTRTGYALMQSKRLTVLNNRSTNDLRYGMLMNNITHSTIRGNRISDIRQQGGAGTVSGNDGKALFVYNAQFNRLEDNRLESSDIGIHLTAGSEDNVVTGNAFLHNRQQVKYVATRTQAWDGNYWSNYLGWDMDDDGVGDTAFEPNDAMDRLLWRYPAAKVLMDSPAVLALRWVQRQFPVFRPQGVRDSDPLMTQPAPLNAEETAP
ncbi:nitrous oxide reductase family maturation protein NosD [Vreelandella subglaciescola]|jgi:nitrous oxidase accessory protein|uniref:Nitrous oxidase accessory protein n=1 Tax=Vreelandella subglaciescola TaxID=29571 RepID=A0A1M7I303_9GAMM|nr:nitrous oxide reductase family maturation protein NosD [Halomonas subglaciescola]SHM35038.1 nitrous oxidase accessory protein [Halomonas subglaciescola]